MVCTRKVCPTGWHVPTDADWTILTDFLGGENVSADKLKESGITHWHDTNIATNESGFAALPGGFRYDNGIFFAINGAGSWWSDTEFDLLEAWDRSR